MAKSASESPANPAPPVSFESALSELESIVEKMEAGNLSLEASLSAYQRGVEVLRYCQGALAAAEQKIQVLEAGELRELHGSAAGDG